MAEYRISLGVDVQVDDIQSQINAAASNLKPIELDVRLGDIGDLKELKSISTEIKNISASIGSLGTGTGMKSLLSSVNQISNALENVSANFGNIASKGVKSAAQAAQQAARQTERVVSDSVERAVNNVSAKGIGRANRFKVFEENSDEFKSEVKSLIEQWTNGKGELVDFAVKTQTKFDKKTNKNIKEIKEAQVKYRYKHGDGYVTEQKTIQRARIGTVKDDKGKDIPEYGFVEVADTYRKSIDKTASQTDKFVRQQKKSVGDLTNQINQLHRSANDQNANRPIKQQGHLDQLAAKYNEITDAIQRMGNASSSTFDDERNNVNKLISEYKSMKSEFKNAENVAGKLAGDDYETGRKIAEQNLGKLEAKAANYSEMAESVNSLKTAFDGVNDAASLKNFNSQLKVANAELDKVKTKAVEADRAKKVGINVSGLKSEIADLQKANPALDKFEANIGDAKVSIKTLLAELGQVKTQGDFSVINSKFSAFAKAAKDSGVVVKETVTQAEQISKIQNKLKDTGYDGFADEMRRANAEAERFKGSSIDLQNALTRLDTAMKGVSAADEAGDMKQLVEANKEYETALKNVYSQIKLNQQAERQGYDKDNLDLDKTKALLKLEILFESGSQAAKKYGTEMQRLQKEIAECANSADIKKVNKGIDVLDGLVEKDGLQRQTFSSKIKAQLSKYSQYLSVASMIMYATQGLKDMFNQVVAIDSAMTELKKVTNETDASYDKFLGNAASRAKEIGTTIDGLVSSTADFARLGYSFEESAGLAEVANIYTVVGDEIDGVDGATQSLVSTLAAFKHEMGDMSDSDFAMSIVDKFNEVDILAS